MSEINCFVIFLFLYLFFIICDATNFVHLIGYDLLAEPSTAFSGVTQDGCAEQCVTNVECIGFDYLNSECTLLKNVRNIVTNLTTCNFYIFDRTAETDFGDLDLSETDKLVYSNAYLNDSCPQGSTDDITECSIVVTEEKCLEYSAFFNASFDGSKCIFPPINRSEFYCVPAGSWLFNNDVKQICYFKTTASTPTNMATFIQNCQAVSTKHFPVSICSEEENDFFMGAINSATTMLGLYLPTAAAKPSRIYEWADGNADCQYRNWASNDPDNYFDDIETVAQMDSTGKWMDVNLTLVSTNLFCKSSALTLQEYADTCNTLDNCAQLN